MKRPVDINKTFEELRKLPLELTFKQVESWVYIQKIHPVQNSNWISLFLAKCFSRSKN